MKFLKDLHFRNYVIVIFLIFNIPNLLSQQLAFPTAVGTAASEVTGGRGGTVIHVTNLNDSGPGSFREALTTSGTRTIIFDVSGVINLTSDIVVTNGNFTVAGQTAPEGGITLIGTFSLLIQADNWIFRYVRFRSGYDTSNIDGGWVNTGSGPGSRDADLFIIDHCSGALAKETAGMGGGQNDTKDNIRFTSQNNLVVESARGTLVGDSNDSDSSTVTIYRNGYINAGWRFPKAGGTIDLDVINTFVYNWENRLIRLDGYDYKLNLIGNYYQAGNLTRLTDNPEILFTTFTNTEMNPQIWDEDTYIAPYVYNGGSSTYDPIPSGYPLDKTLAWDPFYSSVEPINSDWFSNTRLPINGILPGILPASQVKEWVLNNSGANKYIDDNGAVQTYRDSVDTDAINIAETQPEGGTKIPESNYESIALSLVVSTPSYIRPANWYNSNKSENIPEVWYDANVPNGASDWDIDPNSGYSYFENYLNQVDNTAPIPVVDVTGVDVTPDTAEISIPDTITLTATITPNNATDQSGVWTSSDETIATVDASGIVTPVTAGEVIITFTTNDGGYSDTSVITVFPEAFEANAGLDQTICQGESVVLSASGGVTYLWSNGETTASIEVSPTVTTTYTVTAFDDLGNSDDDTVTVTVNELPIAEAGNDQTICEGDTVTLSASGGNQYLWSTGETTASISVAPTSDTAYTVEVTTNGCSSIDDVNVFVNPLPNITVSNDVTIMDGETTTLTVSGSDNYLWSTGETTESIDVTPSVTTTYTVTSISVNGCTSNREVTVTVVPELIANAGEDVEICSGEETVLTASGGVSYTWNTGGTSAQLTVSPNTTTTYTVTVEDGFGNSDSDSVTVTVNDSPTLTITEDLTIVEGESIQLTVSDASTYLWSTGETSDTILVTPNTTTTYTVIGTTATCSTEAQVTVTVEELLVVSAGQDENVCENDSYEVVLTASSGDSYLWSTGETTQSITVSPLSTTTYSVTVTSGIQEDADDVTVFVNPNPNVVILNGESVDIMSGDFVTLSASGANTYEWNNGATQPNIAVSPSQTTTYEVRGYIGDCYDEKQVTVNVIPEVEADAGEDQEICLGDIVTLTATGGDGSEYEYEWSTGENTQSIQVSPTETTEYTVTVFNALDFDEDTVTVFVDSNCTDDGGVVEDPIDGTELDFEFSVFPNPATEFVDIKLSGSDQLTGFYIYDITGKLILQKRVENESLSVSSTTRIDVSSFRPGIYLIKLADVQRELFKRLIVR